MFESTVKAVQRDLYVAQVHGIVCYFANHLKLLVTYGDIASALGSTPRGGQLAQALGAITEADHKAGNPPSTAVVVNKHAGRPGSGFFVQCRQLGWPVGPSEADEEKFWLECLNRLKVAPYTLGEETEEAEPERIGPKGDPEFQRRHTSVAMAVGDSPTHRRASTRDSGIPRGKAHDRGVSLNVKKRPLDAPDDENVLRARLAQADKAGWTGPTKAEPEPVEAPEHSMLPGD
jgi:hypothetical protein